MWSVIRETVGAPLRVITVSVRGLVVVFGAALSVLAADPPAPNRSPRIRTLSPPGVSIGGRETWTIEGENLAGIDRIEIEGDGVSAVIREKNPGLILAEVRAKPGSAPGFRAVRAEGADGFANLRVVRIDSLSQTEEREPNDTPDQATPLPEGSAGVGKLGPLDLDHFRVTGKKGQRVTIEVEARRLGLDVSPVVTVMSTHGKAWFQERETPGVEGDCRFLFDVPADGPYLIQVRDTLYGGSKWGFYRLRVTAEPFATGLFPLGGPPGRPIKLTASGGNLSAPLSQTVNVPDRPREIAEIPPFRTEQATVIAPGRIEIGDGPEVNESAKGITPLSIGLTVNGRIDRPGEIDRFRIAVKAGRVLRFKIVAAALGSWLDSVVTIRDSRGKRLAENDDLPGATRRAGIEPDPDSRLEFKAESDADLTVEVADRFGRGGPEYGYRFLAGDDRPDFTVHARIIEFMGMEVLGDELDVLSDTGAYQLKPGASLAIGFEIDSEGQTGPITLRAEGLPDGVKSAPIIVHPRPLGPVTGIVWHLPRGVLTLRADLGSAGVSGRFRVKATATLANGQILERLATQAVLINTGPVTDQMRRLIKRIAEFPVRVMTP